MASRADLLLGYRSYSGDELLAERTALRSARTLYVSQNMGQKGFTKNLELLESRLAAVDYLIRGSGSLEPVKPAINIGQGCTDFGGVAR